MTHISCHGNAGSRALAWTLCIASGHAARPKYTSTTSLQPLGRTPTLQVTGSQQLISRGRSPIRKSFLNRTIQHICLPRSWPCIRNNLLGWLLLPFVYIEAHSTTPMDNSMHKEHASYNPAQHVALASHSRCASIRVCARYEQPAASLQQPLCIAHTVQV